MLFHVRKCMFLNVPKEVQNQDAPQPLLHEVFQSESSWEIVHADTMLTDQYKNICPSLSDYEVNL